MSDSEGEFESADEGSNGDDGWEIESDFDLLDIDSKKVELISTLPNTPNLIDIERNNKNTNNEKKSLGQDYTDTIQTIQLKKDKIITNQNNLNSKESKVLNEIEPTSTQSSVSTCSMFL